MNQLKTISAEILLQLMINNNVTVLDIRSLEEFQNGHIYGAIHIPVEELSKKHDIIQSNNLIVTYCGKGGGRSDRAATILNEIGRTSLPLEGGYYSWIQKNIDLTNHQQNEIMVHQLFEKESSSYTYLLADKITREAVLIDPVLETVDRDLRLIEDLNLELLYILDTHLHVDHITGSSKIKKQTGAKSGVSKKAGVCCADLELIDGQEIKFGRFTIKVLETPGHTSESLSFYCAGSVFTGDTLLIRSTGRTDFQNGSSSELFDSIHNKLYTLPDNTKVFPGHDYNGFTHTTIVDEKRLNSRISNKKEKDDFIKIMDNLKLPKPKKIDEAVPANLQCGKQIQKQSI
ncbi:MAG: MBL fold metallo-hydrolase [Pseudobdellovibrio sp.]